jgi:hypothetical protein
MAAVPTSRRTLRLKSAGGVLSVAFYLVSTLPRVVACVTTLTVCPPNMYTLRRGWFTVLEWIAQVGLVASVLVPYLVNASILARVSSVLDDDGIVQAVDRTIGMQEADKIQLVFPPP